MNSIKAIQQLNQRELEAGISTSASWHNDYRDTAWVYVGGFPYELSEGDILTVLSQFGEPTHINLVRDKETGKSKGFCFLRYEDQRSTDLAVDNLGGAELMGRVLRVDHTRYKRRDDEDEDFGRVPWDGEGEQDEKDSEDERPVLEEEIELERIMTQYDDEDPMKKMLIKEKQEEVEKAIKKWKKDKKRQDRGTRKKHRSHRRSDKAIEHKGRSPDRDRGPDKGTNGSKRPGSRERRPDRERRNGADRREDHDGRRSRSRSLRGHRYDRGDREERRHRSDSESRERDGRSSRNRHAERSDHHMRDS